MGPTRLVDVFAETLRPPIRLERPTSRRERQSQNALICNTANERIRIEAFGQVFETKAAFKRYLKTRTPEEVRSWKWAVKHSLKKPVSA